MPYLKASQWTGVGKQTAWGKGCVAVDETYLTDPKCSNGQNTNTALP